jgi:dihydroxy-acid dehydratase
MSGTSFGTCVLHVAPEAAVGGPLGLVRDGDTITLDVAGGRLDLEVGELELLERATQYQAPVSTHLRGWPALYQQHVTQADLGCDFDFLRADTPAKRRFVPPVVGRS